MKAGSVVFHSLQVRSVLWLPCCLGHLCSLFSTFPDLPLSVHGPVLAEKMFMNWWAWCSRGDCSKSHSTLTVVCTGSLWDKALGRGRTLHQRVGLYEGPSCVAAAAEVVNWQPLKYRICALLNPGPSRRSREKQTFIQHSDPYLTLWSFYFDYYE